MNTRADNIKKWILGLKIIFLKKLIKIINLIWKILKIYIILDHVIKINFIYHNYKCHVWKMEGTTKISREVKFRTKLLKLFSFTNSVDNGVVLHTCLHWKKRKWEKKISERKRYQQFLIFIKKYHNFWNFYEILPNILKFSVFLPTFSKNFRYANENFKLWMWIW